MRPSPPGYTLIELLLAMALVVIAVALAAPSVMQGEDRSQVQNAANDLANLWGRARLDAITSGKTLVFRCELGGSKGTVENPFASPAVEATSDAADPSAGPSQGIELTDIVFSELAIAEPAGSEPVAAEAASGSASPVIVFRPDGATSDAEVVLKHESGRQIKVTLRGLTGTTRVVEVEQAAG